jgi:predicted phage baseplate assembly protein
VPIIPPGLDDRRFDDLVQEMLARIPAHTPEWTNPRQGDPGRTLIELFAWLADTILYRANLVPERQRLVFLRLLGQRLHPARPARGIVAISHAQKDATVATRIAPGGRIDGPVPFETLSETTVLPITAEVFYKRALGEGEHTPRMSEVLEGLSAIHGLDGAPRGYVTTPLFDGGRAAPDGVEVFGASADRALWLALLAPEAPDPTAQPEVNEAARSALGGGDARAPELLTVGVVPALDRPDPFDEVGPRAAVPVLWEITTRGRGPRDTGYLTLDPVPDTDTTRGLSRAGVLRLSLPDESRIWAPSNDVGENPRAGVGDAPPRLDDVGKSRRLLAWIRVRPAPGQGEVALRLAWLGTNAVEVAQRVTMGGVVVGTSNGAADQNFSLPAPNVDPDSLAIEVEEPGQGYRPWVRVDDLSAISPDPTEARNAAAFEVDPEAGLIRFGDGVRGRIPERRMRVRLARGHFGGGSAGNLPAGTLSDLSARRVDGSSAPPLELLQPLPTEGGAEAETLAEAERRIPGTLRHRERAVTGEDYRRLTLETPGVRVGRVEVLPRFKPRDRRFDIPGVVSVMALPDQAISAPPNPRPDRPFIETVHAHLSARVPLTTELYVIGCEYVPLGLSVGVTVREGHSVEAVRHGVRSALRRLLWPLAGGGPDGTGWPLGRPVAAGELEVEVSRVPGVREVSGLKLFGRNRLPEGDDWRPLHRPRREGTASLLLEPWQLPELLSVIVAEGPEAPGSLDALPNPFSDEHAVAVPVVPEVC